MLGGRGHPKMDSVASHPVGKGEVVLLLVLHDTETGAKRRHGIELNHLQKLVLFYHELGNQK